jgi:hypothetical protein
VTPLAREVAYECVPIEGADRVVLARIEGGLQCVVPRDLLAPSGRALFVGEGAVVDVGRPRFAFLRARADRPMSDGSPGLRVRVAKVRSHRSDGVLVPIDDELADLLAAGPIDADAEAAIGVEAFEPIAPVVLHGGSMADPRNFDRFPPPSGRVEAGEPVVVTEALLGVQVRVALVYDRAGRSLPAYVVGNGDSARDTAGDNAFARWARAYLPESTVRAWAEREGLVFFRHAMIVAVAYGPQLFDLGYGCAPGEQRLALVASLLDGRLRSREELARDAVALGVAAVPEVARVAYGPGVADLAEGPSLVPGAAHARHGVVVTPAGATDPADRLVLRPAGAREEQE